MATERHRRFRTCGSVAVLALGGALAGCGFAPGTEPVFCYRTLADVVCYATPDPDRTGQLVGGYDAVPGDPVRPAYWRREAARMSR